MCPAFTQTSSESPQPHPSDTGPSQAALSPGPYSYWGSLCPLPPAPYLIIKSKNRVELLRGQLHPLGSERWGCEEAHCKQGVGMITTIIIFLPET